MSTSPTQSVEQILDRFDDAWNGPTPPRIEEYLALAEQENKFALLIELVRIDLERRRKAGEQIHVEEMYLRRWPRFRKELSALCHAESTLPSASGETLDRPAPQPAEEAREVFAFLSPPQATGEIGRLGSYRVLKMLGAGGMGVVFLAEDTRLKRLAAVKVMRPVMAADAMARQRFLREAQAMAALKNERIVSIYQVEEERGVPYLAMEYLQGETLHERLRREAMPPLSETLSIALDIAAGLAIAHERGLIHRDIKPANIWLEAPAAPPPSSSEPPRVKLLDFGLARPAVPDAAHLTQTGVLVGTPAYMSPEQARGESVDASLPPIQAPPHLDDKVPASVMVCVCE